MNKTLLLVAAAILSAGAYAQMIAHYPFSGNANDATGNGYDGTTYGGVTLTNDRFGNPNSAYEFDGVDDYINTFSTFDFEFRTMAVWARPYDIQGDGFTEKHIAGQDANTLNYGQLKAKFSNGNLECRAGGESSNFVHAVNNNTWYHIVLVREGAISRYYLNNVLIGTGTSGSVGSSGSPNEDFVIGTGRELINQFFHGVIDDVRIYNKPLSEQEIDDLFNEPNPALNIAEVEFEDVDLTVYPNPSSNLVKIESNKSIESIQVYDNQSKLIAEYDNTNSFSVTDFSPGQYHLSISLDGGLSIRRRVTVQ